MCTRNPKASQHKSQHQILIRREKFLDRTVEWGPGQAWGGVSGLRFIIGFFWFRFGFRVQGLGFRV